MSWFSDFFPSLLGGAANIFGQHSANSANRRIARDTNAMNLQIARETNASNAQQVANMMNWQERMSNSAYQRQMEDLRRAGINPMLAASLGGAGTPPGASIPQMVGAPMQTGAPMQNEMSGISSSVNSAFDNMKTRYEIKNMVETAKNLRETNKKIASDTALNRALRLSAEKDALLKSNSAKVAALNADAIRMTLPGRKTEAAIDESAWGKWTRLLQRANPLTHSAKNVANIFD